MGKQIGDHKLRIAFIFSDVDFNLLTVGADDDSVKRQGHGRPLVFLYSAVIVGFKEGKLAVLVKGMLF